MKSHVLRLSSFCRPLRAALVAAAAITALLAAASVVARPLLAHEKGVLTIGVRQAGAGDTLQARGSKLAKGAAFRIELRGALKTYSFGRVHADSTGGFILPLPIPADATSGSYTVVAIAADGDVSGQAELMITPAARTGSAANSMAGMPGMVGTPGPAGMHMEASAAMMDVPSQLAFGERVTIILSILIAVGVGVWLLRPAKPSGSAA